MQGDTKFLEGDIVDKLEFQEENDWIFDKIVVTDAGDSDKMNPGQISTLREIREENSLHYVVMIKPWFNTEMHNLLPQVQTC
jgi:hypothetical protein